MAAVLSKPMPRRRLSWDEKRAEELNQAQRDRQLQKRASLTLSEADPDQEPQQRTELDFAQDFALNCRITGLMRARYGAGWASSTRLHKLAERALADLRGHGDGKSLQHLRNGKSNSGTYAKALELKYGAETLPNPNNIYT